MFLGNVSEGTLTAPEHVPFVRALVSPKLLVDENQIRTNQKERQSLRKKMTKIKLAGSAMFIVVSFCVYYVLLFCYYFYVYYILL